MVFREPGKNAGKRENTKGRSLKPFEEKIQLIPPSGSEGACFF